MKFFSLILLLTILLFACRKQNNTPTTPVDNPVDTTLYQQKATGIFMNGPYGSVMGKAVVYEKNGNWVLALDSVIISNGPDLHVYLSKEIQPASFIDLGRLQSVSGNQQYSVPGQPDLQQYRYALIHCKQFNHLFGSAELR